MRISQLKVSLLFSADGGLAALTGGVPHLTNRDRLPRELSFIPRRMFQKQPPPRVSVDVLLAGLLGSGDLGFKKG